MKKYKGSYVALVTPFKDNMEVDYDKLIDLVEFQIKNKTNGIVVCGTTAETPTLSDDEYAKIIKTVVNQVNGRVQVIAGAGANSTKKAIMLTRLCKELGVDAVLSTCPYYNKPTQRGIIAHYEEIAKEDIDVIVYNVPSRTGVNIQAKTSIELSKIKNIVGIKEASGDISQMIEIANEVDDNFSILSGEDHLVYPMLSIGCDGVISVVANILPDKMSELCNSPNLEMHKYLYDISKNLFIEGNPVTVKEAMDILGLCSNNLRLPLVSATKETRDTLISLYKKKGLIK